MSTTNPELILNAGPSAVCVSFAERKAIPLETKVKQNKLNNEVSIPLKYIGAKSDSAKKYRQRSILC